MFRHTRTGTKNNFKFCFVPLKHKSVQDLAAHSNEVAPCNQLNSPHINLPYLLRTQWSFLEPQSYFPV